MTKILHVYIERNRFAYQLRRGVLLWLLGTHLAQWEYVIVQCMNRYCNCERRDPSSNHMLTKY